MVGAPSFVEARSLCGGPMTLVIDESNSIGRASSGGSASNVTNVKQGARDFVTALAGTPVKLQVIGFHTFSHALGTTEWHRYFDMANDAEVAELLAAIETLRFDWSGMSPNGGTNWEEGLFRAFYTEQGLTAEPVPNRVVFFTDGIPTFDRLVHRTGDLPADPPDPGPAWADSTGSAYSQVAFNRADFIAQGVPWPDRPDRCRCGGHRQRDRELGGVASDRLPDGLVPVVSPVPADPDDHRLREGVDAELRPRLRALFVGILERHDAGGLLRQQHVVHTSQTRGTDNRRINSNNAWRRSGGGAWQTVLYNRVAANLNLRSILGLPSEWFRVDSWTGDQGLAAYNAAPAAEKTAGLWRQRTVPTTTWVTKAQYDANNTTPDASDGWTALSAPEYVSSSSGTDWVEWPGSRSGINSDQFRSEEIEGVPPYDGYRPAQTVPVATHRDPRSADRRRRAADDGSRR